MRLDGQGLNRDRQHGFVCATSCLMNPFAFFDDVTKKVVEGKVVGVYMDFSEAFQNIG